MRSLTRDVDLVDLRTLERALAYVHDDEFDQPVILKVKTTPVFLSAPEVFRRRISGRLRGPKVPVAGGIEKWPYLVGMWIVPRARYRADFVELR